MDEDLGREERKVFVDIRGISALLMKCHNDERYQVRSNEENVESKSNEVIMTIIHLDPGFRNLSKASSFLFFFLTLIFYYIDFSAFTNIHLFLITLQFYEMYN